MAHPVQIVIDAADPAAVAEFWAAALGYALDPPPPGFDSWPAFLAAQEVPEERWNDASAVSDPDRRGPRIFIQRVPEPKQGKNRLHLDIAVSGGPAVPLERRRPTVDAEAERLVALGARKVRTSHGTFGEYFTVMHDVEGNEFCVT